MGRFWPGLPPLKPMRERDGVCGDALGVPQEGLSQPWSPQGMTVGQNDVSRSRGPCSAAPQETLAPKAVVMPQEQLGHPQPSPAPPCGTPSS